MEGALRCPNFAIPESFYATGIDALTSAYGLFQVAFSVLDTRLSRSVVALFCCKNVEIAFAVVKTIPFGRRLEILRKAIKAVAGDSETVEEIEELKHACKLAKDVSEWRNKSIHCDVRFIENRPVILDEEGKPLQVDYQTCVD